MQIMDELMDDVILVSEDELRHGVFQILQHTHNLAEGAGASALALGNARGEGKERPGLGAEGVGPGQHGMI